MKKLSLTTILILLAIFTFGQKKIINIPNIPGYITLKCDLHIHTVFSDGEVWPTYRINEAWMDGLDALSITDHLEYQPHKKYIPTDHNAARKIAKNLAKERNLILIHSTEITGDMPPGHLNAHFIDDASLISNDSTELEIEVAASQGAFIQWNHPGWKAQEADGIPKMYPIIKDLLDRGIIRGIELFNSNEHYVNVLEWCKKYNISVIATSDEHGIISEDYPIGNRPMTLVFARERNAESVKEALMDGRTVAYFENILAGPEKLLSALFNESISVSEPFYENETRAWIEVTNSSDVPYYLTGGKSGVPGNVTLGANTITVIRISKEVGTELIWTVSNLMTGTDDRLKVELK